MNNKKEASEKPQVENEVEEEKIEEVERAREEKKETSEAPEAKTEGKPESEEETAAEEKKPEAEEEAKPSVRAKPEEKEEVVEERTFTVPLGKAWIMPARKRSARAVRILRSFIIRHMKMGAPKETESEEEEEPPVLTISNEVNERIWQRGIEKPPRKIRVRATKDEEGNVTVYLAEGE